MREGRKEGREKEYSPNKSKAISSAVNIANSDATEDQGISLVRITRSGSTRVPMRWLDRREVAKAEFEKAVVKEGVEEDGDERDGGRETGAGEEVVERLSA
jgi:hypothetical protein